MTTHIPRVRLSVDPLMAEAKRRMRQRRLLAAALGILLVGGAVGAALAVRGPGGGTHTAAGGNFGNIAFRSPAGWSRVNWNCWIGPLPSMLLFTTARPTPTCRNGSFPPHEQLGANGGAVWLEYPAPPLNVRTVRSPNAHIDGQPARITAPPLRRLLGSQWVTCAGAPGRALQALIQEAGRKGGGLLIPRGVLAVRAVVCGPDYAKGEAAVRQMLASIRFRR